MTTSPARPLRHRAIVAAIVALVALALFAPAALAAPGAGQNADQGAVPRTGGVNLSDNGSQIARAGGSVYIAPWQTVESVTVFGGDAVIAGTVRHTVVAVGGDVILRKTAQVGTQLAPDDTAVFAIGGKTVVAPGAAVTGTTGALKDVSIGEALVAGSIAMTGAIIGGTIIAAIVFAAIAFTTLLGLAALVAFVWLIVWLIRRDNRKAAALTPGAGAYAGDQTAAGYALAQTQAGAPAQGPTQATLPYGTPAFSAPPATA